MNFRTLTATEAVFDELLRIVPCTTGVTQGVGHELTGDDRDGQEPTESQVTETEANSDGGQNGQQGWGGELALRSSGADRDDLAVLWLFGVVHDAGVLAELATYFFHHGSGRAAYGANGQCREQEGHRTTDEGGDEGLGVSDVDWNLAEHVTDNTGLLTNGLDEGSEECHGGDNGRTDSHTLGDGLGRVTNGVEADENLLNVTFKLTGHFGNTGRVVRNGTEGVFGHDHAGGRQEADTD